MIAVARKPPQPNTPATTDDDQQRITELDADYVRLHARTVRRLTASLHTLADDLRRGGRAGASEAQRAFITRHVGLLREAYLAGWDEGAVDYYGQVSRTPKKWARRRMSEPPTPQHVAARLQFYAPSVAKMAHEALVAWEQSTLGAGVGNRTPISGTTLAAPRPSRLLSAVDSGVCHTTAPAQYGQSITLDDATATADPLDGWLVAVTGRVNLQADIGWPGMQDGYAAAGAGDNANPFTYLYWILGSVLTEHCATCIEYAAGSPYNEPGSGGNELDATPGDGHTECGAACKCILSYKPAGQLETEAVAAGWAQWLGGPQNVAALSAGPDAYEAMYTTGAQVAAAGGDVALEPLAPEEYVPGSAPSGGVGADVAAAGGDVKLEPISPSEYARYPGMVQPSELPYMQMPSVEPPLPALMNPFAGIPAQQTIPFPTLTDENLSDQQKAALDAFRVSVDAWDAVRGDLPKAPAFFSETLGEYVGEGLPDLALMTPEQRSALYQLWDALALWDAAMGEADRGQQLAEHGWALFDPNQPRGAHGRWVPAGGSSHTGSGTGRTGHTGGGGQRTSSLDRLAKAVDGAKARYDRAQKLVHGRYEQYRALVGRRRNVDPNEPRVAAVLAKHARAVAEMDAARAEHFRLTREYVQKASGAKRPWDGNSTLDEHDRTMPFNHFDAMAAWRGARSSTNGNINDVRFISLGGREYLMKSAQDTNVATAREQQTNEAATVAGMKALGYGHLAPDEAYHIVDFTGVHYAIISKEGGQPNVTANWLSHFVSGEHLQQAWLGEYALGMKDRHRGNVLMDPQTGSAKHIDFGYGMKHNAMVEKRSWPAEALKLASYSHADAARHGHATIERTMVEQALSHEGAVTRALEPFGLSAGRMQGLHDRFDALRYELTLRPGHDMTVEELASGVGYAPVYAQGSTTP